MSFAYASAEDWDDFWRSEDIRINDIISAHQLTEDKQLADRIYEGFYTEDYDEFA